MPNTIVRKSRVHDTEEFNAGGTITPGHLIDFSGTDVVVNAGDADVDPIKMFAIEDRTQGLTIDDDYSSGEIVMCHIAVPGDRIYAQLDNGENVAAGATLESAGNGNLQALSTGAPVAKALEAVDASGGTARINVVVV